MSEREPGRRTRWCSARLHSRSLAGAVAFAALAASARAEAPPVVKIQCPALDQHAAAALEARALGILLVSGGAGQLSLECNDELALAAWRSDTGELRTLGEPLAARGVDAQRATLEQLFDLVARLMPAASEAVAAQAAAAAPSEGANPPSTSAAAPLTAAPAPPPPPPAATPPLPSPFEEWAAPPSPSPAPSEGDAPSPGFAALRLGVAGELWSGAMCCTAGFVLGAAVPVSPSSRLGTSGSFEMGVSEARDIAVRHARFGLDLELEASTWLALSGGLYVSALWLDAPDVISPATLMSVQPVLALQALSLVPLGPHVLALGPVLRGYARERALRVDGSVVARQPALTLGLAVELRIRL